jgi:hypothetical protein
MRSDEGTDDPPPCSTSAMSLALTDELPEYHPLTAVTNAKDVVKYQQNWPHPATTLLVFTPPSRLGVGWGLDPPERCRWLPGVSVVLQSGHLRLGGRPWLCGLCKPSDFCLDAWASAKMFWVCSLLQELESAVSTRGWHPRRCSQQQGVVLVGTGPLQVGRGWYVAGGGVSCSAALAQDDQGRVTLWRRQEGGGAPRGPHNGPNVVQNIQCS